MKSTLIISFFNLAFLARKQNGKTDQKFESYKHHLGIIAKKHAIISFCFIIYRKSTVTVDKFLS